MIDKKELIFLRIANDIEQQIKAAIIKAGEKLPSLRSVARDYGISIGTVVHAYFELEKRGMIEPRPQSGYYVIYNKLKIGGTPAPSRPAPVHFAVAVDEIYSTIFVNNRTADVMLSSSQISADHLPFTQLNRELVQAIKRLPNGGASYSSLGNKKLQFQIAKRSRAWGGNLSESDIVPTSGSMDALSLSLLSLLERGDTIAVESPVNFGIINLIQTLGFRLLELPTDPVYGVDTLSLKKVLAQKKVKLVLLMSNFSNPFGSCMNPEKQQEIVRLITHYNIPMIEDDVFAELYFTGNKPTYCKAFDEAGMVLLCGSVSKILAGGYRVGWLAPGQYKEKIFRTRPYHAQTCNSITHDAIASFFENNKYDAYLKVLRQKLYTNSLRYRNAVQQYFPEDTKITCPAGGIYLWVELAEGKDTLELYNDAMLRKISITPGRMFTTQNQFNNCLMLNFSMDWTNKIDAALKYLGKLSLKQKR
jgi:DNA-binding transcriptional MocR family regulator